MNIERAAVCYQFIFLSPYHNLPTGCSLLQSCNPALESRCTYRTLRPKAENDTHQHTTSQIQAGRIRWCILNEARVFAHLPPVVRQREKAKSKKQQPYSFLPSSACISHDCPSTFQRSVLMTCDKPQTQELMQKKNECRKRSERRIINVVSLSFPPGLHTSLPGRPFLTPKQRSFTAHIHQATCLSAH